MDAEENTASALSESELAYFQSGGETEVVEKPVTDPTTVETTQIAEQEKPETVADPEPSAGGDKGKMVPHGALHAEREEHKKTKAQLEEISRKQAILDDRWNTLIKAANEPKQTEEDTPPDPNEDIFAFSKWQQRQLEKLNEHVASREKQETEARQQQDQENAIWSHWQQSAQAYAAEKPDFNAAAEHLAGLRTKQLSALGFDQNSINQTINQELRGVIIQAAQSQKSPAELIYNYAIVSGYTPAAEKKDETADLTLPENLARISAAQDASKTIGQAAGRAGGDEMTAEKLAAMPAAEFDAWAAKNQAAFKKLMGA